MSTIHGFLVFVFFEHHTFSVVKINVRKVNLW